MSTRTSWIESASKAIVLLSLLIGLGVFLAGTLSASFAVIDTVFLSVMQIMLMMACICYGASSCIEGQFQAFPFKLSYPIAALAILIVYGILVTSGVAQLGKCSDCATTDAIRAALIDLITLILKIVCVGVTVYIFSMAAYQLINTVKMAFHTKS